MVDKLFKILRQGHSLDIAHNIRGHNQAGLLFWQILGTILKGHLFSSLIQRLIYIESLKLK